jgi:hypothetical protein
MTSQLEFFAGQDIRKGQLVCEDALGLLSVYTATGTGIPFGIAARDIKIGERVALPGDIVSKASFCGPTSPPVSPDFPKPDHVV